MADFMLTFIDENDENLFSAVGRTIPRRGEVVSYELLQILTEKERADWDAEALAYVESIRNKSFEVIQVYHSFRKSLVMQPEHHIIFVMVKEVKGK